MTKYERINKKFEKFFFPRRAIEYYGNIQDAISEGWGVDKTVRNLRDSGFSDFQIRQGRTITI